MALIKEKQVDNMGITGNYWRIVQNNQSYIDNINVIDLVMYASTEARQNGSNPLPEQIRFTFKQGDHPVSDLDVSGIDTSTVEHIEDLETQFRYLHIKNIAQYAQNRLDNETKELDGEEVAITTEDLTLNEQNALFFIDAIDG